MAIQRKLDGHPNERKDGTRFRARIGAILIAAALLLGSHAILASDFNDSVARIDHAIKTNPGHVPELAIESCLNRRNLALRLYRAGEIKRAERSIQFSFEMLQISATPP